MSWADQADRVLAKLFGTDPTRMPTRQELRDAYPFSMRRYWPYKAWLRRRRAWLHARKMGLVSPYNLTHIRRLRRRGSFDQISLF